MTWFFNLNSKSKLMLSFTLVIVFIIGLTAQTFVNSNRNVKIADNIDVIISVSYSRVSKVIHGLTSVNRIALDHLHNIEGVATDGRTVGTVKSEMQRIFSESYNAVEGFQPTRMGSLPSTPEYQAELVGLQKQFRVLNDKFPEFYRLLSSNPEEALKYYLVDVRAVSDACLGHLNRMRDIQMARISEFSSEGADYTSAYIALATALIAVLLSLAVSMLISNYIDGNIRKQMQYLRMIAEGNFDFKIADHYSDDFGECINAIRTSRNNLSALLSKVLSASKELRATLVEVQGDSRQIHEDVSTSESQTVAVSAAANEMVSTTQNIAHSCESALQASEQSKQTANDCVDKIKGAFNLLHEQSEHVKSASTVVENLAKRSMAISSIVNTIEEIASQTNLLALNAAIEAARAGVHGRGFAVVADEVRALASRTSASTQEIVSMVTDIQNSSKSATEAILNSVQSMEATLEESHSVELFMDDIHEQVNRVNNQISQIATAAQQQTTASSEISQNMQHISSLAGNSANLSDHAIGVMQTAAESLSDLESTLAAFRLRD